MPDSMISHVITLREEGITDSVFISGTFTDPIWTPQLMQRGKSDDGSAIFTTVVSVKPGNDYHYKFRVGDGGKWAVDGMSPISADEDGDECNLLKVPPALSLKTQHQITTPDKFLVSKLLNKADPNNGERRSSTPIAQVAQTAAEVADTASALDNEDTVLAARFDRRIYEDDPADLKTPLFAHESFGGYEFVDDRLNHDVRESSTKSHSRTTSKEDDIDVNDPTLERFPSNRSEVINTLRKVQSSKDEDPVHVEDLHSSRADSNSRGTSVDSTDESLLSTSPTSSRRREHRLSHGSSVRNKSAASLGAIAEEPKTGGGAGPRASNRKTSSTDEDETMMMSKSNVKV